jgi:hypothetical protein
VQEDLNAMQRAEEANSRHRSVEVGPDVVRRPASAATETVHSLLRHLRAKGFDRVPEPLGVIGGIEELRFMPGESGGDGWYHQHTDQGLESAARLLRAVHDAGADWKPDAPVWGAPPVPGEDQVFCHGDPGPWNFIWDANEAIGLIDWDYLHPGPRLDDVSYALRWFAPLRSDRDSLEWHHFPAVPVRRERVRTFLEAYGRLPPFDVVDAVTGRIRAVITLRGQLADQGIEPQRTWVADGADDRDEEEIRWIESHGDELQPYN